MVLQKQFFKDTYTNLKYCKNYKFCYILIKIFLYLIQILEDRSDRTTILLGKNSSEILININFVCDTVLYYHDVNISRALVNCFT